MEQAKTNPQNVLLNIKTTMIDRNWFGLQLDQRTYNGTDAEIVSLRQHKRAK